MKVNKKINMKTIKKIIIPLIFLILLGVLYFQFSLIVTPDGSDYFWYTSILDGERPFSGWSITRGFSFPILLYFFKHLFGNNPTGILIGFFLFYILLLFASAMILKNILNKYNKGRSSVIYWILYILLIMFNPLIIGYSHTLLTEAIAPAMIMLTLFLSYKWKDVFWNNNKKKVIIYTILFALIIIFMWFLKQPYMPIIFFIMFIFNILIGIREKSFKKFFEKFICIFIALISLLASILIWNAVLERNHINTNASNSNSGFLATGILRGLNNYYSLITDNSYCDISYIENSLLSEKEKEKIISLSEDKVNWCDYVRIYNVIDNDGLLVRQTSLIHENSVISVSESLNFWLKNTLENPRLTLMSYYRNYMGTINLYQSSVISYELGYKTANELTFNATHENTSIGLLIFQDTLKCWWQYPTWDKSVLEYDEVKYMKDFEGIESHNQTLGKIINNVSPFYLNLFKVLFFIALPLAIFSLIKFIKHRDNDIYMLLTVIFGASFLHVLFHAVLGATIDRYAFVAFPLVLLGLILLFVPKKSKPEVSKNNLEKIKMTDKSKIIFVIPVFNESKHIEKVINDIRKNMPKADIVITNDYSTDNTKDIVESLGVICLNVPFNMGYAMAVQTGIKYAYEQDYDFVIQFDGDGQHLASEAEKLINKYKESDANIIIGSRFLKKTNYKHPLFRKIGTKLFQLIIKWFCKKEITDPTSGFQLLDKNVIKYYSKIGNYPEFPDANLIIEMLLKGYKIEEVSVNMKENDEGKSMHGGIIKPIKYMINIIYTIMFILIINGKRRN